MEQYEQAKNMQRSETLKKLFSGASALNYMGIKEPFKVTIEMLKDEKYFDNLFTRWYEEQKKN